MSFKHIYWGRERYRGYWPWWIQEGEAIEVMSAERPFVPFVVFRCPYAWSSSHYYYLNFLHYCPELLIFYVTDLYSYQHLYCYEILLDFIFDGEWRRFGHQLMALKGEETLNKEYDFEVRASNPFFFLFLCDIGFKEIDTLGTVWSGFRWALLIKMLKFCVWTPFFVFNDLVGLYIHILWTSICRSRRPHPVEALTNRVLTWDNLTWTGVIYNCISWWHGLNRYPKLNYE